MVDIHFPQETVGRAALAASARKRTGWFRLSKKEAVILLRLGNEGVTGKPLELGHAVLRLLRQANPDIPIEALEAAKKTGQFNVRLKSEADLAHLVLVGFFIHEYAWGIEVRPQGYRRGDHVPTCTACCEAGHYNDVCPVPGHLLVCLVCGGLGHRATEKGCPEGRVHPMNPNGVEDFCIKCLLEGHRACENSCPRLLALKDSIPPPRSGETWAEAAIVKARQIQGPGMSTRSALRRVLMARTAAFLSEHPNPEIDTDASQEQRGPHPDVCTRCWRGKHTAELCAFMDDTCRICWRNDHGATGDQRDQCPSAGGINLATYCHLCRSAAHLTAAPDCPMAQAFRSTPPKTAPRPRAAGNAGTNRRAPRPARSAWIEGQRHEVVGGPMALTEALKATTTSSPEEALRVSATLMTHLKEHIREEVHGALREVMAGYAADTDRKFKMILDEIKKP